MTKDKSRIQSCIDHINTAVDVDPWAKELVAEMGKEILKAQLSCEGTTSDCIGRQAAIRIASGYCHPANVAKELAKLPSVQPDVPDTNVGDLISRQPEPYEDAVSRHRLLNDLKELIAAWEKYPVMAEQIKGVEVAIGYVKIIPSVTPKPEPLSDAYMKAVWTWLLDYQIKAAELKGRYTPYEVLSWVANDWRKEHE